MRVIEAHWVADGAYEMVARLLGTKPGALPPLQDLVIDPAAI